MANSCVYLLHRWRTIFLAGVFAGTAATGAQVLLWLVFTDDFPAILFRDARLTAALALGGSVLPPPAAYDFAVMLAATLIHFALSVVYAALLIALAGRMGRVSALLAGLVFGVVLYAVNLYGFTEIFPWFAQARGWIALVAHGVFGVSVIIACRFLHFRNARCQPGGH